MGVESIGMLPKIAVCPFNEWGSSRPTESMDWRSATSAWERQLVRTTVEAPKPYMKEVWHGEGNLLIDAPGDLPGAFLCLGLMQ
jgi:hypothetical protein